MRALRGLVAFAMFLLGVRVAIDWTLYEDAPDGRVLALGVASAFFSLAVLLVRSARRS